MVLPGSGEEANLPPHLFSVAAASYAAMLNDARNQSLGWLRPRSRHVEMTGTWRPTKQCQWALGPSSFLVRVGLERQRLRRRSSCNFAEFLRRLSAPITWWQKRTQSWIHNSGCSGTSQTSNGFQDCLLRLRHPCFLDVQKRIAPFCSMKMQAMRRRKPALKSRSSSPIRSWRLLAMWKPKILIIRMAAWPLPFFDRSKIGYSLLVQMRPKRYATTILLASASS